MADVKLKFITDVAALATAERRIDALNAKLDAMAKKKTAKPLLGDIEKTSSAALSNMLSTVAASLSLTTVMQRLIELNKEWSDGLSKVDDQLELATVRLAIQTGKGGPELKKQIDVALTAMKDIPAIATVPEAVQMQTFLASSDIKKEDVESGAAMRATLGTMVALNAFGAGGEMTGKEATKTVTAAVTGFGLPETAASIEKVGSVMAGAFKETKMTGEAVPHLVEMGANLSRFGISLEESFGAFAPMVSAGIPGSTAAHGLSAYSSFLGDVKPESEREEALESVGLTQADVAPQKGGVTLYQSLDRLGTALEGKDEKTKNQFFADMFGRENASSISNMLQQRELMRGLSGRLGDRSGYDAAQETFASSDYRRRKSSEVGKTLAERQGLEAAGGVSWEEVKTKRAEDWATKRALAEKQGQGTFLIGLAQLRESFNTYMNESFGISPKSVATNPLQSRTDQTDVIIELLKRTAENTGVKKDRHGNVEPTFTPSVIPSF